MFNLITDLTESKLGKFHHDACSYLPSKIYKLYIDVKCKDDTNDTNDIYVSAYIL